MQSVESLLELLLKQQAVEGEKVLCVACLETPLGSMISVADDNYLYVLEFANQDRLERTIKRLNQYLRADIVLGETAITEQIKKELVAYFSGELVTFKTPILLLGTDFQQTVWRALQTIPLGETRSYIDMAKQIDHDKAYRALVNANGANQLAIIVPCHRVINESGELGGYGGGVDRKRWLLGHEGVETN